MVEKKTFGFEAVSEGEKLGYRVFRYYGWKSSAPPKVDERRGVARPPRTVRMIVYQDSCVDSPRKKVMPATCPVKKFKPL